jgi:glycosyltransferase involved in cell wall biosynthesis
MKLIIQIPAYNEEATLGVTLDALPRSLPGLDAVEFLVVDDGSDDRTVEVARAHGAHHVVRHVKNMGLARAFKTGLDACLLLGADIIVNTDADNQYRGADIEKLVAPILDGKAEIVIGARPIREIEHFSPLKKLLQNLGSWAVRAISNTHVHDAPSGFRAFSRDAAMKLNVFNDYTYTLETIIQAGLKNLLVMSVPVGVNADLRPSRLVRSVPSYLFRSLKVMILTFMTYKPFQFFLVPGLLFFIAGLVIGLRFLVHYLAGTGQGMVQSLILAALLIGGGGFLLVIGFLAELIGVNRKLLEQVDWRMRKLELAAADKAARRP